MAIPIVKFQDIAPYEIRQDERRIIKIEVKPNAVGSVQVRLFLTAAQCTFFDAKKELIVTFEAIEASEKKIVSFNVQMQGNSPRIYLLKINAEAINGDQEKNKVGLLTKLDCKKPMTDEAEQTVTFDSIENIEITVSVDIDVDVDIPDGRVDTEEPTDEPVNN